MSGWSLSAVIQRVITATQDQKDQVKYEDYERNAS
jgi:hypothetical protein